MLPFPALQSPAIISWPSHQQNFHLKYSVALKPNYCTCHLLVMYIKFSCTKNISRVLFYVCIYLNMKLRACKKKKKFFLNHVKSDISLSVHKAVIKIVAGQDCGTKSILVKGSWILKPHARSAAMGPCKWTLVLPLVPPDCSYGGPDDPREGPVQSMTLSGWGTSVPFIDWSILTHILLQRKGTGTL